ncbi:MAG: hypothetical protein ACFB9M_07960 [Myxococcota bacterium]
MSPLHSFVAIWQVALGVAVAGAVIARLMGGPPAVFFLLCAASALLVAATAWRAFTVHRDPTVTSREVMDERASLRYERDLALQAIKEIEADAAAGKIDQKDVEQLRASAEERALHLIRELRRREERAEASALRLAAKALKWDADPRCFEFSPTRLVGGACESCGRPASSGDRYCAGCGRSFEASKSEDAHSTSSQVVA